MLMMSYVTFNVTTVFVMMHVSSHMLMMMFWLVMLGVMNVTALRMMLNMMMFHFNLLQKN